LAYNNATKKEGPTIWSGLSSFTTREESEVLPPPRYFDDRVPKYRLEISISWCFAVKWVCIKSKGGLTHGELIARVGKLFFNLNVDANRTKFDPTTMIEPDNLRPLTILC